MRSACCHMRQAQKCSLWCYFATRVRHSWHMPEVVRRRPSFLVQYKLMWGNDHEQDINITDDDFDDSIGQHGGAPPKKAKTRVLIAGLTRDQDELLQTVQYKTGLLAGRDSLYLATRQFIEEIRVIRPLRRYPDLLAPFLPLRRLHQRFQNPQVLNRF